MLLAQLRQLNLQVVDFVFLELVEARKLLLGKPQLIFQMFHLLLQLNDHAVLFLLEEADPLNVLLGDLGSSLRHHGAILLHLLKFAFKQAYLACKILDLSLVQLHLGLHGIRGQTKAVVSALLM